MMDFLFMDAGLSQEVGARYWVLTFLAAVSIWGGLRLALRSWIAKKKGKALGLIAGGLLLGVIFWFFAQASRQIQVFEDPGLPDVVLPDMDLSAEPEGEFGDDQTESVPEPRNEQDEIGEAEEATSPQEAFSSDE